MMSSIAAHKRASEIKQWSKEAGFILCGISEAQELTDEARKLEKWLSQGAHGAMDYMGNHFEKRTDPRRLLPGAKSVISFIINYYPAEKQRQDAPKVSKYAYGRDYHKVVKKKAKWLIAKMRDAYGDFNGRAFVDSAPVMDKAWAQRSGIGWIGKHSNLLNRQSGSFFFIGEIICDLELEADAPTKDYCGTCTRCIDACPTDAISPYEVDGSKCISYLTIELKSAIPKEFKSKMDNWIFGCDVCQDVCPWNRFSKPTNEADFKPKKAILEMDEKEWIEITKEVFDQTFAGNPLRRAKYEGIQRNLEFISVPED